MYSFSLSLSFIILARYDNKFKYIKEKAQKIVEKHIKTKDLAKLDFLASFKQSLPSSYALYYVLLHQYDQLTTNREREEDLNVNWYGVVVKLHEIISQTNSYPAPPINNKCYSLMTCNIREASQRYQ